MKVLHFTTIGSGLMMAIGCGGSDTVTLGGDSSLLVAADPPGFTFDTQALVEINSSRPATIFYTLDGTSASSDDALEYFGPIHIDDHTLLSFTAVASDGIWSVPGSELYAKAEIMERPEVAARMLSLGSDSVFFEAKPGEAGPIIKSIGIRSTGTQPVRIQSIALGANPIGAAYFDPNAFEILEAHAPITLAPGEATVVKVSYMPTRTLRAAAIMIASDEQRNDGQTIIELWGRQGDR